MKNETKNILDELASEWPSDKEWNALISKCVAIIRASHEHLKKNDRTYPDYLIDHKLNIPFEIQVIVSSKYSNSESRTSFYDYEIFGTYGIKCRDLINDGPKRKRDLKALKRLTFSLFDSKPFNQKKADNLPRGNLEIPEWIVRSYKERNGFSPNFLVSSSRNIPKDIQSFVIAAYGYIAKPSETSFWEKFENTQIVDGLSRAELLKTEDGLNIIRNHLLRWVNSAWY